MLSRVAEHIYWMARYIERAENTARLVNVNTHLLLDLPRAVRPGWGPLIAISGAVSLFEEHYQEADERSVIRFLLGDMSNPGSILGSLNLARENARTIRDIIPREAWEQVNALFHHARGQLQSGISQRSRFEYLKSIILGAQQITGLLAGTMAHDAGYSFLRMGRNLERADMTTRIIDVRSADLLAEHGGALSPFEHIQWMSVLKSLTAYQMYRRHMQVAVRRSEVLQFLFHNRIFPRSCYHCLCEVEACLHELPRNDTPLHDVTRLQRILNDAHPEAFDPDELHTFIDQFQLSLGQLHALLGEHYFSRKAPATEPVAAEA